MYVSATASDIVLTYAFAGAPAYAAKMRPGTYPKVLRNLHISAMILSPMMMLFVLALLPLNMQTQENVLCLLA